MQRAGQHASTPTRSPRAAGSPGLTPFRDATTEVYGLVDARGRWSGIGFWFVLNRTRFGFDLRATGMSETAAVACGVNVKRMVVISMLLSGAVAGLIWMPALFGAAHTYGTTFQAGLGFTGIAVALLGRNQPLGIALRRRAVRLPQRAVQPAADPRPTSRRTSSQITQGVIVLAVVVAYEVVRRYGGPPRAARGRRASWQAQKPTPRRGGAGMSRRHRTPTAASRAARTVSQLRWLPRSWLRRHRWPSLLLALRAASSPARTRSTPPARLRAAMIATCPILLAALGGLWSERAGVVNIGLEGQMILGTWGAAYFTYYYGPWVGVLGAACSALIGGLLHALATVTFGVDHIVSGVAINIIAPGAAQFLAEA